MAQTEPKLTVNTLRITLYASVIFLLLFGLGVYGFLLYGNSALQAFYNTLKLVLLDAPDYVFDNPQWALIVATLTLPMFPAAALLSLLIAAVGVQWQLLRVTITPRRHVFLGAGKMASSVAQTLAKSGERSVLAVDRDNQSQHAQVIAAQPNALVLQHDVDNYLLLRKLRLDQANTVYVFTGNDEQNLLIARKVVELLKNCRTAPRLVINIESVELLNIVTEAEVFRTYQQKAALLWFSAPQQKAREISRRYPIRLHSSMQHPQPVHVAVVGQSAESEALILQLAKQNALLNHVQLHLTLFGRSAEAFSTFMLNHPVLSASEQQPEYGGVAPAIQVKFVTIGEAGMSPSTVRASMQAQQNLPVNVAYILEPNDYQGLTETIRMCQVATAMNMPTRIITSIMGSDFSSLKQVQASIAHYGPEMQRVEWFHALEQLFDSHEGYPGELSDLFGLLIHSAYRAIFTEPPLMAQSKDLQAKFEQRLQVVEAASREEWLTQLPEAFKASSRQSGDHIFVKLRELGFQLRRRTSQDEPRISSAIINKVNKAIEQNIDALLRLEHTRFCNERLVDGWLFHSGNDKALKLNRTLIPFAELSPEEVLKDEVIIRVMPVLLRHPYVQKYYILTES